MSTTIETEADGKPIHLFINPPSADRSERPINFLTRRLGLAVHGRWLLTGRGEVEMTAIGLVLIMIFLFDWMAWTLLFNSILNSEILALTGLSVLAVLAGALFAAVVMVYERQFVTSDTSYGLRKQALPIAIRLTIIVGSAFITAQPVHLLFFREPVRQRVHEEGIRTHVLTILDKLDSNEAKKSEAGERFDQVVQELDCRKREEVEKELYKLQESEIDLRVELSLAVQRRKNRWAAVEKERGLVQEAEEALGRQGSFVPPPAGLVTGSASSGGSAQETVASEAQASLKAAQDRLASAESNYASARNQASALQEDLEKTQLRIGLLRERLKEWSEGCQTLQGEAEEEVEALRIKSEEERQALRNWVQTLVSSSPVKADGRAITIGGATFTYQLPPYDFFAQLAIVDDLRSGAPPRWLGSSGKEMARGAEEFGLTFPKSCGEKPCSEEEKKSWESVQSRARHFRWSYLAVYGIAMVIPTLVFALKLLLPEDLISYYSTVRQARAGNPDAQRLVAVGAQKEEP